MPLLLAVEALSLKPVLLALLLLLIPIESSTFALGIGRKSVISSSMSKAHNSSKVKVGVLTYVSSDVTNPSSFQGHI